jgi:site-specific DNA-methyltransferase (adenine-specific)
MTTRIIVGDCLQELATLADCSVDSIVTDPPYGLAFMGKKWDYDVPGEEIWRECLRVLKPGGHLLAFAGTRTQHRMAVRIEDAGFEIRDMIAWVYGSGFPKSLDVSKAIDKAAGAQRTFTPVGSAVKRMIPGADQNATGSWIKDNGREYQPGVSEPATEAARQWQGWGTALKPSMEPITVARKPLVGTVAANTLAHGTGALNIDGCRVASEGAGRWPANLIHDGSDEVVALFPAEAGAAAPVHKRNGDKFRMAYGSFAGNVDEQGSTFHGDTGSAARFFYCAKADKADRGEGNTHPTVKPGDLMRYLIRLVTPPGGTVLDPFMGSGSTLLAANREGFNAIGVELNPEYAEMARRRLYHDAPLFAEVT